MRFTSRFPSIAVAAFVLAACNPFHRDPVVQVNTGDVNLNSRWHGTLTTPATLQGALEVKGTVTMIPSASPNTTLARIDVSNVAPGGIHPWEIREGQCGAPGGTFGSPSDYKPITIDKNGRATTTATVSANTPTSGSYAAIVYASPDNAQTVIACANLAPPTP